MESTSELRDAIDACVRAHREAERKANAAYAVAASKINATETNAAFEQAMAEVQALPPRAGRRLASLRFAAKQHGETVDMPADYARLAGTFCARFENEQRWTAKLEVAILNAYAAPNERVRLEALESIATTIRERRTA